METSSSTAVPRIIVNPAANRGHIMRIRALLHEYLRTAQGEYIETSRPGEAGELACSAAHEGRSIVVVGGDGTLNEVASGILRAGKHVPLGIIAAGSGNDYAWNTLKLPRNFQSAIATAFHGTPTAVDAGIANGRYFVNGLSIGLDADITVAAEHMKRWPFMSGPLLYYSATLRQLFLGYHRCPWLRLMIDGVTIGDTLRRYVFVAIMNGTTYGAGFHVAPAADHTDGIFEVCVVCYLPLRRALRLLPVVKRGEHRDEPEVTFYQARTLRIEARQSINVQMDGETWQEDHVDVRILPGALLVRTNMT